jgi:hypothetical protein
MFPHRFDVPASAVFAGRLRRCRAVTLLPLYRRVELPVTEQIACDQCSTALEDKTRSSHQSSRRARHEHLAGKGAIGNPPGDLESDSEYRVGADLALAGMNARTDVEAHRYGAFRERVRASDSTGRALESRDETIPGFSGDSPTEPRYLDRGRFLERTPRLVEAGLPQL